MLKFLSNSGMSLIQVLVSSAILSGLMVVFYSFTGKINREMKYIGEKQARMELFNFLNNSLKSGKICEFEINHPTVKTVNLSTPSDIASAKFVFSKLHSKADATSPLIIEVGKQASPSSKSLIVKSIKLKNFVGSGGHYLATWVITFDDKKSIRTLKPIFIKTTLQIDESTPSHSKVVSCSGGGSSSEVFSLKASIFETATGLQVCYGTNLAAPNVNIQQCEPPVCPPGSVQIANYIESKGVYTYYVQGTGHYKSRPLMNNVRVCKTSNYKNIHLVKGTFVDEHPNGSNTSSVNDACHGVITPSGSSFPTFGTCDALGCPTGEMELSYFTEGSGGGVNYTNYSKVRVCGSSL